MPSSAAEYIFSLVRTAKLDQGSRGGFGFEVLGDRRDYWIWTGGFRHSSTIRGQIDCATLLLCTFIVQRKKNYQGAVSISVVSNATQYNHPLDCVSLP